MGSEGMGVWELPEGWDTARLGELVEMKTGFACAKKNLVTEGLPHLRPFNVSTEGELDLTKVYHIPKDFKENADDYTLEPGHILFNNTNSVELVGKTAIVRQSMRCAYSNHITRLTVLDKRRLEPNWLALSLKQLWATGFFAANCNKWIGQAGVNTEMLAAVEVPLPYPNDPTRSLAEQRRIVARIEELFARIADARHARAKAHHESDVLFKTVVRTTFDARQWIHLTIERLVGRRNLKNGKSVRRTDLPTDIRCLRLSSLREGRIDCTDAKPVPLTKEEAEPYLVREGDVFVARGSGSKDLVGQAGIVEECIEGTIFPDLFIRVPLDPSRVLPPFFAAWWNSPQMRARIEDVAKTTSGIWKINQGHIASFSIPIPPLPEQRRIVEFLHGVQAQVAELKRVQAESAAELERLEGAILARAFRGEL
jgi:type I restriction enzyme S subunit